MPLPPATRLGPYEIVAPLGAGGMGEVYRARDPRLKRDIAIKVLPAELSSSPDRLARFEREAMTVAGLNHPNIVVLHSIEEADGIRFLTMELVEGQDLADMVTSGGLPLTQLLDLAISLADALVAAHEKGVVHRDLKPANVMMTRQGRVKVLDFGLAKHTHLEQDVRNTQAATMSVPISEVGEVVGTAPYMAPEQLLGQPVDARTDLFSFGILVHELASGRRPFTGPTFAELSSAILRDNPPSLQSLRSDLPAELAHIVERCLEKNPRERFQTALDVLNELRSIRRTLERAAQSPKPTSDKVASIAVLPFVNRSASAEDEYFSDGLADELLNVLAKIKGLRVIARSSAFTFKGRQATVAEIGKALDVATVLEGSVRKAGSRVRISVQLVRVADSSHLWSETYDRTLDDIFAVQDDIAHSVVKELRTTLLGEMPDSEASGRTRAEVAAAAWGHGRDSEAHRLYLQGKYFLDRLTQEDTTRALEYLNDAVTLDPTHVLAWLELSRAHGMCAGYGWGGTIHDRYRKAREAADRALSLAPDSAEAHTRLANLQLYIDWDWKGAEKSLRRALELSPNNDPALRSSGSLAIALGRFEAAERFFRSAIEQDPLNAFGYHSLGTVYRQSERLDEAERAFRKALELAPQRAVTRSALSLTLLARGRLEEAEAEAVGEPQEVYRLHALAIVHHALGRRAESDAALRDLSEKHADTAAFQVAEVHGARGESDRAIDWLERAYAQRDSGLAFMKNNPNLRALHGDPRWGGFLKRMGLAD